MTSKSLILAFLLGAALAGLGTWLALGASSAGDSGAVSHDGAAPGDGPELAGANGGGTARDPNGVPTLRGASDAPERMDDLARENRVLKAEIAELEAQVEGALPRPRDPQAFRFGIPAKAASFDEAAWTDLASHMTKLVDAIGRMKDGYLEGEELSGKDLQDIQKHNTPLAVFAIKLGSDIETAPNAAYTHPAVIANLIRSALAATDDPLSAEQEIAIKTLGDAWLGEMARLESALSPNAPALAKTVTEVDGKLRFLASAKNVLTPAQRDHLFNPETEGRLQLDLLSPALTYTLTTPVHATDREDMEAKLLANLFQTAGLEIEDLSPFEWVARQWVDDIPGVTTGLTQRSLDLRFPHVDTVQSKARAQVAATERILAMGALESEQEGKLREVTMLLYPFVIATPQ